MWRFGSRWLITICTYNKEVLSLTIYELADNLRATPRVSTVIWQRVGSWNAEKYVSSQQKFDIQRNRITCFWQFTASEINRLRDYVVWTVIIACQNETNSCFVKLCPSPCLIFSLHAWRLMTSHGGLMRHWLAVVVCADHVITPRRTASWRLVLLSKARVVQRRYKQEQSLSKRHSQMTSIPAENSLVTLTSQEQQTWCS